MRTWSLRVLRQFLRLALSALYVVPAGASAVLKSRATLHFQNLALRHQTWRSATLGTEAKTDLVRSATGLPLDNLDGAGNAKLLAPPFRVDAAVLVTQ